jgi:hypothetical protein
MSSESEQPFVKIGTSTISGLLVILSRDKKATVDLGALSTAFEVVANTDPQDMFDWSIPCTCPDSGIMRDDCSRYVVIG